MSTFHCLSLIVEMIQLAGQERFRRAQWRRLFVCVPQGAEVTLFCISEGAVELVGRAKSQHFAGVARSDAGGLGGSHQLVWVVYVVVRTCH